MSSLKEFSDKVEYLNQKMKAHYAEQNEKAVLLDGIVNVELYYNAFPKILWILKEPYDKDNENESSWHLSQMFDMSEKDLIERNIHKSKTWLPVMETNYCIVNDKRYEDVKGKVDISELFNVMKHTAVINVKKTPGNTTTPYSILKKTVKRDSQILLEQIHTYVPDIIIGGNTMYLFWEMLFNREKSQCISLEYWNRGKQIFIDAAHPSKRTERGSYTEDILDEVDFWRTRISAKV